VDRNSVIVVTGAAGFIGSCLVGYLNRKGFNNIIIVDDFSPAEKLPNFEEKNICYRIERDKFFDWLDHHSLKIDFFFHLGARTDTTEFDYAIHQKLNVEYSQRVWQFCTAQKIPLVYASSAATYGSGEWGYNDDHEIVNKLQPLNPYGVSKNEFDKWVLQQAGNCPPFWTGLKFFNVYGPNEYHKGRMASVIFHAFNQIKATGKVKLFKSHRPDFKDGEQLRDFVYVKDVVDVCFWFMNQSVNNPPPNGLYNLGTGNARTFLDLATSIFNSLELKPNIEFIDTPEDIREKYQYFTEANMAKLRNAGYKDEFYTLENGVETYVKNFLAEKNYY
jgi:ADP-L-glycero-D-manno-heptose 6-epimerase